MTIDDHAEGHAGPSIRAYAAVFGVLLVCTALSFAVNLALGRGSISGFAIILAVAMCKASLVAAFFMHLVLDWRRVYMLIVPALILGPMLVIVLLPDMVLAWRQVHAALMP